MAGFLRKTIIAAGLTALLCAPVSSVLADQTEATAEELQLLFQRQKSRGLKLAPNTAVAPTTTATATAAATGTESVAAAATDPAVKPAATEVTVAEGTTGAAATEPVAVAYTELDKADQINFRIGFDFDSAVLRDSEKPKLASLCTAMKAVDVAVFRIVGHTDAAGTDAYNEKLSLLRAEEVKRHLASDACGIEPARLQAVGVGKRYLYNTDDPRSEENRRVEFQALS